MGDLPVILPDNSFIKTEIRFRDIPSSWFGTVFDEFHRCWHAPDWNPKLKKLEGDIHLVDTCAFSDDGTGRYTPYRIDIPYSVTVIEYVDHPFLAKLPTNAPRAAKTIYRKEVRLKHLRSTSCFPIITDLNNADRAWADYLRHHNSKDQ